MLKYQKKGLCKALSMLLAAVMLMTAPIGTTQAYALEGEQPTVTDVQNELPFGVSEGTATDEMLDSGTPLEEPSPPADSNAPEDTPSDAEETELERNPATPSNTGSVQNIGMPYGLPTEITVGTAVELEDAINKLVDGDTIKLTANIDYNDSITISKEVTLDVGQYTLNIIATKYDYLTGLEVTGSVSLISTTGELNVTGSRIGVMVRNGEAASATVTNATATQPDGIGIHATSVQPQTSSVVVKGNVNAPHTGVYAFGSGSTVTVRGNVNATDVGAEAESDANIVVYGGIEAESCGAKIVGTGRIIVQKDITTTGADSTGAWIKEAGSVRIDGDITAVNYIKLGSTIKHKSDGVADPDLSGYTKYTDGNDRVVWVKGVVVPSDKVCEIGSTQYATLDQAIAAAKSGEITTITLLKTITHTDPVVIDSKAVTFNLNGFSLTIDTSAVQHSIALDVKNSGGVSCTGDGYLDVKGQTCGVQADNGIVTVRHATATMGVGASAGNGGQITITGDATGKTGGVSALNAGSKITVTGNVATVMREAVEVSSGGQVTVGGNVSATGNGTKGVNASSPNSQVHIGGDIQVSQIGVDASSSAQVTVDGNVSADGTGIQAYGVRAQSNSKIKVLGNVSANPIATESTGAVSIGTRVGTQTEITIDGTVSGKAYIRLGNLVRAEADKETVTTLSGYHTYTHTDTGGTHTIWIKDVTSSTNVCEIDGTLYASLSTALEAVPSGGTIKLLQSITHHEPVVINGKSITFALGGFDLTIDTSGISNSTGLWVLGDGKVSCTGSGKLNVVGSDYGVRASGGSELHISGNVTARQYAVMAGSASGIGTPKVTVDGDITVTGQDVNASSEVEAVSVGGYATVTIGGNVTANRTDERQSVTAVYSNASTIVVGKNVTTQGSGVNAQNGGKVTIGGALHYNPTGSGDQAYIKVGYPVVSKTADDFEPTSIKPEYKEYKNGDNVVWVKEAPPVCTIGAQKFTSLNAAIASVPAGGTATITLLQSITHTKHIRVEKNTINLDLMDYNLLLDTSADGSYSPALMVIDDGKLNLIGSGTGEFNIKSHMTAISAVGMNTKATVHNVVAGDSTGVNMVGSGDYLDSSSTVTVLGSITVGNGNGVEVNAKNGKVVVGGNITAGRIGVDVRSNPGTQVTVNGDITVDGDSSIAGIWAYGATTVAVTGDVTVRGTNCVGVHASGSTIKVDGNVASSGKGAHSDTNGKVEITGSLTAGTPFIVVGTAEMTADQGIDTGGGSLLYTDGENTVQIGSSGVSAPTYIVTVQNDGHGTGSASPSSAEAGTEITLTATANGGYVFKEWQVVSGGMTISDNKFSMPAGNVTVKAIFEATSAPIYSITVQNDGNGTGSASTTSAEAGTEVTLTASPNSGFVLKEWQVISGGVTVSGNKLTMPAGNVTVKAIFEAASAPTYLVTINDGGSGATGAGSYEACTTVNIYAGTRSNYTFTGWTSSDVAITNASNKNASFTMHGKSVTVTANWTYNGGSGGSNDSGSSTVITTTPGKTPDQPVIAEASVTATAGANGAASVAILEKSVTDAIAKAQADAKAQEKTANVIAVKLNVTMPKGATSLTATLTRSSLNSLVSAGVSSLTINGSPVTVCFDQKALAEIQKQSSGDVTITIKLAQNLSVAVKRLIGTRPVYDITVSYVKDGKATVVSAFNGGIATIFIPYKPGKNEATGYLYGVYADEKGNATRIEGSAYDANAGVIIIPTGHLSVYGVGYTAPSAKFTDIGTHWGKESIDYAVGRGLLGGTSETTFAPDTVMTRGMLVTALGRLAGVDVKAYTGSSFTDVKADSAFRPYIEWAYKKGVVQGIGNSQFAPDRAITREEIAVIFANYTKATGYKLPVTRETTTYADASSIGSAYKTAVTAMQQAGIMMVGTYNKFNPKASATRAEVSSMLHRYVKLTIEPTTAQGWALNDAGQYLYYKDGKSLAGTQTIDGAKYFFNTDGTLKTVWVKDGDNWRYYSGNKAAVGWLDISDKRYYFTKDGLMVSSSWLQIDSKWYYFNDDGSLDKNTTIDGYELDKNGVRKTK